MADANDLYKDDLYGDLDLEDLDATQLEELVEPPELEPAPTGSSAQGPPAATPAVQQQNNDFAGQQQPAFGAAAGAGGSEVTPEQALDRIRPSDMPDEGGKRTVARYFQYLSTPVLSDRDNRGTDVRSHRG
uniref:Uncharacterized protein n=1 Tax=Kwoniella dejecticola CBS 10117 TaxID=1296121 RepID=A0A1A6ADE2_9TREE|nr:uncharacterized protein I303_02300 [Kwoniella dejecticola CBS 10117]OBR88081.1 hypothetical protein I303_02300 [Kwoniella dejecticola CBS 10117]